MKTGSRKTPSITVQPRRSSAYWRTRYEQLKSDFDELLAVNQVLSRHIDEIEGGNFIGFNMNSRPFGNSTKIVPYPVPGGIR